MRVGIGYDSHRFADRRKLILGFQGANMAVAVLLAVLWQTHSLTVPLMGSIGRASCRERV